MVNLFCLKIKKKKISFRDKFSILQQRLQWWCVEEPCSLKFGKLISGGKCFVAGLMSNFSFNELVLPCRAGFGSGFPSLCHKLPLFSLSPRMCLSPSELQLLLGLLWVTELCAVPAALQKGRREISLFKIFFNSFRSWWFCSEAVTSLGGSAEIKKLYWFPPLSYPCGSFLSMSNSYETSAWFLDDSEQIMFNVIYY